MISAPLHPAAAAAHLDERHNANRVQQERHSYTQQPKQGEDEGKGSVFALGVNVEETPGAGRLDVVATDAHHGQQGHAAGNQPHQQQHGNRPIFGEAGVARERTVDPDETLGGHGGAEQQWAQPVKDHRHAHEVAEVAVWVHDLPVEVSDAEGEHDGACGQQAHEICDHQPPEQDEEGGARLAVSPLERLDEDAEGHQVGEEAQRGEDGGEVERGDGGRVLEGRFVEGVAEGSPVAGGQGRGVHGGQRVRVGDSG